MDPKYNMCLTCPASLVCVAEGTPGGAEIERKTVTGTDGKEVTKITHIERCSVRICRRCYAPVVLQDVRVSSFSGLSGTDRGHQKTHFNSSAMFAIKLVNSYEGHTCVACLELENSMLQRDELLRVAQELANPSVWRAYRKAYVLDTENATVGTVGGSNFSTRAPDYYLLEPVSSSLSFFDHNNKSIDELHKNLLDITNRVARQEKERAERVERNLKRYWDGKDPW